MQRRKLLTFLTGSFAGIGVTLASLPFIRSMGKPKHIKPPLYHQRVMFPKLQPGRMMTAPGSGNTLYVVRRTAGQVAALKNKNISLLDPDSLESDQPEFATNSHRSLNPEYFIAYGMCTHLGCSTTHIPPEGSDSREYLPHGGFFCACHGAQYDSAGRVYKNMPAKYNLVVPEYEFIDETTIRLTDTESF